MFRRFFRNGIFIIKTKAVEIICVQDKYVNENEKKIFRKSDIKNQKLIFSFQDEYFNGIYSANFSTSKIC